MQLKNTLILLITALTVGTTALNMSVNPNPPCPFFHPQRLTSLPNTVPVKPCPSPPVAAVNPTATPIKPLPLPHAKLRAEAPASRRSTMEDTGIRFASA